MLVEELLLLQKVLVLTLLGGQLVLGEELQLLLL